MTVEELDLAIQQAFAAPWPEGVAPTIWTIGHGTKSHAEIGAVLGTYSIDALVDCRHKPFSRYNPQWNQPAIRAFFGPRYIFAGKSLGNPATFRETPIAPNVYDAALDMLIAKAKAHARICLMCSEADWKRCHRHSMIARSLDERGVIIVHLVPEEDGVREFRSRSQEMVQNGSRSSMFD